MTHSREAELEQNLAAVQSRISRAVETAGIDHRPELIVVTKYFPAADVERLYTLGVHHIGENKDQEAAAKAAETSHLDRLNWHFIGQLQSNKAKSVVRYAYAVHSVDRQKIARALAQGAEAALDRGDRAHPLHCLIQVDLRHPKPDDGRGGAAAGEIPSLAEIIAEAPALELAGLMAVAPPEAEPRPVFERLAALSEQLRADHPQAAAISAGMSQDLEDAVAHGATHLRIGRDVLGARPYPR